MTHLYLVRHGETDWNIQGRWQGQINVALNAKGQKQAQDLAKELAGANLQAIYSSDLRRAIDTARPLAQLTGLTIQTDARLREIHQGIWQGRLASEIQAHYVDVFQQRVSDPLTISPPGGETVAQVQDRALQAVHEIVQRHPDERVAIFAHGFVIAVIRVRLENQSINSVWELVPISGEIIEYSVAMKDEGFSAWLIE